MAPGAARRGAGQGGEEHGAGGREEKKEDMLERRETGGWEVGMRAKEGVDDGTQGTSEGVRAGGKAR